MDSSRRKQETQTAAVSREPLLLHQTESDEDDDNVKQLNECSNLYLAMQECLNRTNRNWKSCQPEVLALKACHSRKNRGREE